MKKVIYILAVLLSAFAAQAAQFSVAWDAPVVFADGTSMTAAQIENLSYRLYVRPVGGVFDAINIGTNKIARMENVTPGRYEITVTAVHAGLESAQAEPYLLIEIPAAVGNLRVVVLSAPEVTGPYVERGYFRLRIEP
jgi:hypothetical protein